ncbi:DUF3267 domain-containing protein [Oceanobacillus halotolerans]|uniref:DUF3267 domain-containing protein n=1 Tax=Oceanobacillus halotolerans TaxID=2663380 RepID=UPI0013DADB07|nr:DUF3267 domain-containing protein [Oceanobacillus halotolerans]
MNCWKSINLKKEYGHNRIYLVSFLIGLVSFLVLNVPFSIIHGSVVMNDVGFFFFIIALFFLPTMHSIMHILPLIVMNKRAKLLYNMKLKFVPVFYFYTKAHLKKSTSLIVTLAPTLLITIPGLIASYVFANSYIYILLLTCVHIAISFTDYLYVLHILKAPKKAIIENGQNGFDILIQPEK